MTSRSQLTLRQGVGTILIIVGVLFWVLTVVFPLTTLHFRLFASLDHSDKLSLAVVAGGASLVGGIIFLLAPRSRRSWRSDEIDSFAGRRSRPYQRGVSGSHRAPTIVSILREL
jgi:hypothetical protein